MEKWRTVEGFPNYMVSNLGRIKALRKTLTMMYPEGPRTKTYQERILKGYVSKVRGRPVCVVITLWQDNRPSYIGLHRLVLKAFVGPPKAGEEGCHNDGDPTHNWVENLRWDTHVNNLADAVKHGTNTSPPLHVGEKHPRAIITIDQARYIKAIKQWPRGKIGQIARQLGIPYAIVSQVRSGKTWRHA